MKLINLRPSLKLVILIPALNLSFILGLYSQTESFSDEKVYKAGVPIVEGFMYFNNKGQPKGFPLEILVHLAQDENINIKWIIGTWPELYEKICNGDIDILPGTMVVEERRTKLDYLNSTLFTVWSELYLAENSRFESLHDLKDKKIAIVKDDYNAAGFVEYIKGFNISYLPIIYNSHEDAIQALKRGDVYAMAGPTSKLLKDLTKGLENANLYFNPTDVNISFPKNRNLDLQEKFNKRLKLYKQDPNSVYHQLIKKYSLASYSSETIVFPLWGKYTLVFVSLLILFAFVFIYMLRKQVYIKTIELKKRKDFLAKVMEIAEMGGWSLDLNSKKIFWSKEQYLLHGLNPKKQITVKEMEKLIHPDDRDQALNMMNSCIKDKRDFVTTYRVVLPSGDIINTKQVVVFEKDNNTNDSSTKLIGITQDISKETRYQQELLNAKNKAEESNRLKTLFINNMSHEIRTPMNGIWGFTSLLDKPNLSDKKRKEYIEIIKNSGARLLRIIDDILEISILGTKQVKIKESSVCLNQFLSELQSIFKIKAKDKDLTIRFTKKYSDLESTFITDELKLNKIVSNLVENSLKFTKSGFVEIAYTIVKNEVQITIKDTGIGINNDDLENIFERFYQGIESKLYDNEGLGLGLGLSIAKENTELIGGKLIVSSEEGKGTVFTLTLPFKCTNSKKVKGLKHDELKASESIYKIIIAEDELNNYLFLVEVLREFNFNIIHARNGEEAIRLCKENNDVKIILMDLKMPVLNGFEATRRIKAFLPKIPIIAQTAYSTSEDKEKAKDAGCDAIVLKPINIDILTSIIKKYL